MTGRVLIVEDDAKIAAVLADALAAAGYVTETERDGLKAVPRVRQMRPDAIILDRGLPGMDGIEVCRQVGAFSAVPILMLTARVEEDDRIEGLETGAADYICKPFSVREVVARVTAAIRRAGAAGPARNRFGPLVIDLAGQRATLDDGRDLKLTPVEFRLLRAFVGQPGRVFTRADLLDQLHADFRDVSDRAIDSHIKNLRRKLGPVEGGAIESVYGVGYRFDLTGG